MELNEHLESIVNTKSDLKETINELDNQALSDEEKSYVERFREVETYITKLINEIKEVINKEDYIYLKIYIEKSGLLEDADEYLKAFLFMMESQYALTLEKQLSYLDTSTSNYKDKLSDGIREALLYTINLLENQVASLIRSMQNLESQERIGDTGQRIPLFFKRVRDSIPEYLRTKPLQKLLDTEQDIILLLESLIEVSLKYQAAYYNLIYTIATSYDTLLKTDEELEETTTALAEAKEQKETLDKEIKELEEIKAKLEGEVDILEKKRDRLYLPENTTEA